jgi:uroporphyrin-III C-methyltransferase/precorrin-2 dehydrogenase/sirohydrochlorin ferrochelatase
VRVVSLFPVSLKLEGLAVLVVGAGRVAEPKIEALLRTGARVTVMAPEAGQRVKQLAGLGRIEWRARNFAPGGIAEYRLVFAATGIQTIDRTVACECRKQNVLCNAVDDPEFCDFYSPAVVERGDLQIAISTNGQSPALAQEIRKEFEAQFDSAWAERVAELGRRRRALMNCMPAGEARTLNLHREARGALADAGNNAVNRGQVYFVGGGPGALDLLTVRATRILQSAEVVLHDELAPPRFRELLPSGALVVNVGKRCGKQSISQEVINALMVQHARANRIVVRLKGGDPALFSRSGEEIDGLREARVEFEIVPGVTAALAAAAAGRFSLTDRRFGSRVVFATATLASRQAQDWAHLIAQGTTLAIYMPGSDYAALAAALIRAGADHDLACAVISKVSSPEEHIAAMTLIEMLRTVPQPAPAIIVVGEAVRNLLANPREMEATASLDVPAQSHEFNLEVNDGSC